MTSAVADAVVLGAGFFGCEIALALRRTGLARVVLVEREPAIMRRASYANQARIHNGYHYPRAPATALSCHAHAARFVEDHGYAVQRSTEMIYAIAQGSRVSSGQFERVCDSIGAPCRPASRSVERLFDPDLIEAVYQVAESVFDASVIAAHTAERLVAANVDVRLGTPARLASVGDRHVTVEAGRDEIIASRLVNATYAALDGVGIAVAASLKRELAEVALIRPPRELAGLGITVMDGPFFSTLPFPPAGLHSLTHVRYTPHESWSSPRESKKPRSNALPMLRDAARYLPCLSRAEIAGSMFEVKAILQDNERDDGRPILFDVSPLSPRIVSILGAKIDNVYDALAALDAYGWPQ